MVFVQGEKKAPDFRGRMELDMVTVTDPCAVFRSRPQRLTLFRS